MYKNIDEVIKDRFFNSECGFPDVDNLPYEFPYEWFHFQKDFPTNSLEKQDVSIFLKEEVSPSIVISLGAEGRFTYKILKGSPKDLNFLLDCFNSKYDVEMIYCELSSYDENIQKDFQKAINLLEKTGKEKYSYLGETIKVKNGKIIETTTHDYDDVANIIEYSLGIHEQMETERWKKDCKGMAQCNNL